MLRPWPRPRSLKSLLLGAAAPRQRAQVREHLGFLFGIRITYNDTRLAYVRACVKEYFT